MKFPTKITTAQSTYLDFARAAAAMAVLFGHGSEIFLDGSLLQKSQIQVIGVLIFFLLSGFLISYSVFRKHADAGYTFTDFFIDRFCRIYCAFIPALIFVWIVDIQTINLPIIISAERLQELTWLSGMKDNLGISTWLGNLFMMQDFPVFQILRRLGVPENQFFIDTFGSGAPFWTISIEWWLYMLFGAVAIVYIKNKLPLRLWHLPMIGFISIVPAYYAVGGTDNCLTLLWIIGMLVSLLFIKSSYWLNKSNITERNWIISALLIFSISTVFMLARIISVKLDTGILEFGELQFSLYLTIALFSLFFLLGIVEKVPSALRKSATFFADYSYSLYLTHFTVMSYIYLNFPGNDFSFKFFWTAIIASNVVGIVFWVLFERHHKKLATYLKAKIKAKQADRVTSVTP